MKRRHFLAGLGAGAAGLAALSGGGLRALAQDYSKDYPLNCTPPQPGGTPRHVKIVKGSVVPRKSAFDLSPAEVRRLRDGYAALRDLTARDPKDPRGWAGQANVHCYYCSGGYDTLGSEIHGGWSFLPWHRCYLYMHERIIGALLGDPTFRLPYWDWDTIPDAPNPIRNTVPPAYAAMNYDLPNASGIAHAQMSVANPLFDRTRGAAPPTPIPGSIVGVTAISTVMCQTGENFTGGAGNAVTGGLTGQLESSPHGPVHIWTGDPRTSSTQPAPYGCFYPGDYPYDPKDPNSLPADQSQSIGCIDMGVLATAAQDPIFFAHHSNIDRLWSIWVQAGNANPADKSWAEMGWSFYDENKNWVTIQVSDVVDEGNLSYAYQPPQVKGHTTTPAACTQKRQKITAAAARPAPQSSQSVTVAEDEGGTAVGPKPHTRSVALPQEHRAQLMQAATGAPQKEYVLHIDGISLPPNGGTIIRVFVDLPDANAKTELDPKHFAGYISVVPSGLGHKHPVLRNVAFDLLPELAATVGASEQLSVTLVPVTAGGGEPAQAAVRYRRIYLTAR